MARLRFPGRPGYRFDRIGILYGTDEARQTTDPTLAIVASIHKGLQRFRDLFGDSDEDDFEFEGFTSDEVRIAEVHLKRAIETEKKLQEKNAEEQNLRAERSRATLASLAAQGLGLPKAAPSISKSRKTFNKILETGLVVESGERFRKQYNVQGINGAQWEDPKVNGASDLKGNAVNKHVKLKDSQPALSKSAIRPCKKVTPSGAGHLPNGGVQETVVTSTLFAAKSASKYLSAAKQILARATKQAVQSSSRNTIPHTHKVGNFILPTKSSRSSRVIKPNKRFLEDEDIQDLVTKQPKLAPLLPPTAQIQPNASSIFSLGASDDKISTFSPFQTHGLSLSPFNMNREKGFPAFSAAPQPSGTTSFTDGIGQQKPLGSLDQPLIIEGKRPRKPSLIMRMKLVEDNPDDEIKLQQQISDTLSPVKVSGDFAEHKATPEQSSISSTLLKYGGTKSLIAPAKLFTGSSTSLSKSLKPPKGGMQGPSQNTVVIRQPKLQLNRTALNRSKAALARSLKAQLKREAKLERKRRHGSGAASSSAHSPGSSLAQLSPFSKLVGDSVIEKHKSGLFEGIEGGAGSFSPGSFSSPPVTPSAIVKVKQETKTVDYQSSQIKEADLLKDYVTGTKSRCLVCRNFCQIKRFRTYPNLPLCKPCKKCYYFKKRSGRCDITKCARGDGRCDVTNIECSDCKFMKLRSVLSKCRILGIPFKEVPLFGPVIQTPVKKFKFVHMMKRRKRRRRVCEDIKAQTPKPIKEEIEEIKTEPTAKKQRHRSEEQTSSMKSKSGENANSLIKHRRKHKSGDSTAAGRAGQSKTSKSLDSGSKDLTNASSLDMPLSVDVGAEDEPFSLSPPQTLSSTKSSPGRTSKSLSRKSGASFDSESKVSEDEGDEEDADKSRGTSRGPRIKHVCRRAAMVFPHQRATFPEGSPQRSTLTLSALPTEEKQQLWAKTKSKCDEAAYSSTEEESNDIKPFLKLKSIKPAEESNDIKPFLKLKSIRSAEELAKPEIEPIEQSADIKPPPEVVCQKRRCGRSNFLAIAQKAQKKKKLAREKDAYSYKRKIRCRECKGCLTPECGLCVFCRDKPKFGGPGKIKKCCIHSVCKSPRIPRRMVSAFIEPKSPPETNWPEDDDKGGDYRPASAIFISHRSEKPATRFQEKKNNGSHRIDGSSDGVKDKGEDDENSDHDEHRRGGGTTSSPYCGLDMDGSRQSVKTSMNHRKNFRQGRGKGMPVEATIQVALADVRNPFMCRLPGAFHRRLGMKRREKLITSLKQNPVELKPVENETAYCFDVPLKTHLIKADFKGTNNIKSAWFHGFALTLTGTTCVRTLCYLCGSAGQQELIFCIVCCQSYHSFCLEENERPEETCCEDGEDAKSEDGHGHGSAGGILTWCCRRCQFCHVCGQQNGLLKCHRCKDTYHPECLGPNYPTRPSRKNIWVCTKCVRCKSCGATTPGVGTNATWTYDFSLCYDCGKLMDKGNFCPICHKCYSDDDWESKMVQCAICESWVHAKCEELTDEMYQLVSLLPEEVQFTCRVCSKEKPAYWESVLKSQFSNGLMNVLNALMSSKCAQLLLEAGPPREIRKPKPTICNTSDVSMNGEDVNATGEVVSDEMVPDSSGDASMCGGEQKCDTVPNACQLDKKLIEKCDCEGALIIGDSKELNKGCGTGKALTNGMNGLHVDSCKVMEFKNNNANPDSSVIKPCAGHLPDASLAGPLQPSLPGSFNCDGSAQAQGESAEVDKRVSVQNRQAAEPSKQTSCDINDLKPGATNPTLTHVASCDSLSPRSIMSNSDSSSNAASPMMTAKACLRESTEPNFAVSLSTFYGSPSRQSVSKNLFQSNGTDTSSVPKTIPLVTSHSVDSCSENNLKRKEQIAVGDSDGGTEKNSTGATPNRAQVSSVSPQSSPTDVSPMEMPDCENHVNFEKNIWETLDKNGEHPREFTSIKNKIDAGAYTSVEEFSEDMVRIIQALLFENESYSTRKKQANSIRSIFAKQMERCFPWFNVNTCKLWEHNRGLPEGMLKDAVLPPSLDHNYAQWLERKDAPMTPQPSPFKKMPSLKKSNSLESDATQLWKSLEDAGQGVDTRTCLMCSTPGDDLPDLAGRLLYCGQDDWIHINCALWSAEVFESYDGSLQNIQEAVSRGKKLKCDLCQLLGATVGCCAANCRANYHFICARKDSCTFLADQTVFCKLHQNLAEGKIITDGSFEVSRRVCVDLEKIRAKSLWGKAVDPSVLSVIIGSCTVEHLGILKSFLSDTEECLYPVDFCSTRMYWSTQDTRRRCVYTCRIVEVKPAEAPELHIADMRIIHDVSHAEFVPLDELRLDTLGIPNFMKPVVIRSSPSSPLKEINTFLSVTDCDLIACRKDLQQYTVRPQIPRPPKPVDLSGLSPSTLALLNIRDPQNYIPPVKSARLETLPPVQEELGLLKIAERLNSAASGKQRHCLMDRNSVYPGTFTSRMKHGGFASKSLSSSPVGFQRLGRQRSNSEERYSSPLSPLASTQAVARVNLALPPMHQQWRGVRARSESPFTSIRCHDITQDRSVSLSPQPRMSGFAGGVSNPNFQAEVSQSSSQTEDVEEPEISETKISIQGQATSDEISADRIKSILAQVPPEVLDENPVSVVIVSDPGEMSEEELVNITISVLERSTEVQGQAVADTDVTLLPEKELSGGDGVGSDHLPRGDHFTSSDVSVEEKGDKSSHQAKSKKAQEASSDSGHGQRAASSGSCPIGHGGTADGSGDDDDRKPCRGGTKREASANSSDEAKAEKGKKVKSSKEDGNQTSGGTGVNFVTQNVLNASQVDRSECAVIEEHGSQTSEDIQQNLGQCNADSKGMNNEPQQSPEAETNRNNNNSADGASGTECCAKVDTAVHSAAPAIFSCVPKSLTVDIQSTSDEESDFLMLDDFSYSETNDEDDSTKKSHRLASDCVRQEGATEMSQASAGVTRITELKNAAVCSDVEASSSTQLPTTSDSRKKTANNLTVSQATVVKPCYVALHKQDLPNAVSLKAKMGKDALQTQMTRYKEAQTEKLSHELLVEPERNSDVVSMKQEERALGHHLENSDPLSGLSTGFVTPMNEKDIKAETDETNPDVPDMAPSKPTEVHELADTVNQSSRPTSKGDQFSNEMKNSIATESESKPAPDFCDPVIELGSSDDDELGIVKSEFFQESGSLKTRRASHQLSLKEDNLHERIVEKIKAESLARRSPGQEGPFKCETCKRMYRTKESYENHVKSCDFEVSTSDEDEKPDVKQLRSSRLRASHKPCISGDKAVLPSSPLNVPLSIIITDEFKDEKFSPSSGRELSDDCSSAQSQDSRRSSLRRSTVTQRNAAPAHLVKLRRRDSKSTLSPDGSTCSSLLSPTRCSSRMTEDKPSPKETMLEAVGLVSRRSLELSPHSDADTTGLVKLQPRISPSQMDEAPKREKKSPAQACAGGSLRPSIMAGGHPKMGSSNQKSVTITYNPVVLEEVTMSSRQKRPRHKRVWWVEASQSSGDEQEEDEENDEDEGSDNEEGVARRTRLRLSAEHRTEKMKSPKQGIKSNEIQKAKEGATEDPLIDVKENKKDKVGQLTDSLQQDCEDTKMRKKHSETHKNVPESLTNKSENHKKESETQKNEFEIHKNDPEPSKKEPEIHTNDQEPSKKEPEIHKNDSEPYKKEPEIYKNDSEPSKKEPEIYKNDSEPSKKEPEIHKNDSEPSKKEPEIHANDSEALKPEPEAYTNDQETSKNDLQIVTRRALSLRSSSSKEQVLLTSTSLPELPKSKPAKSKQKEKKTSNSCHKVGPPVPVPDGVEQLQADAITSLDDEVSPAAKTVEPGHMQTDITNESILKEGEVLEQGTAEGGNDGAMLSPLRRSLRSSSKSAKLSEYLAELKKDEADDSPSQDTLTEPEVSGNVDKGRAKTILKKAVEGPKGKRGRPKGSGRKVHAQELKTDASQHDKGDSDIVLNTKDEVKNFECCLTSDLSSSSGNGLAALSNNSSAKESLDDKQSEMSDANGDNKSDNQNDSNGNSAALTWAGGTTNGSGSSSSTGAGSTDVKDKDAGGLPPSAHPTIDGIKFAGQKLRFVIRSPNVDAAQKIGELIKKRALASNASSSEIIVTTVEPERMESKVKAVSEALAEHKTETDDNSTAKLLPPALQRDGLCGSTEAGSIGSGEASRSISPDSISAAYDIQSDDFSSESSNDADDYPVSSRLPDNSQYVEHAEASKKNDSTKLTSVSPEQDDDDDDDVVIVKAIGLQPPEPYLSRRTPDTVSLAPNLPTGRVNSFSSTLSSSQKDMSPVLRYLTPQPTLSIQTHAISQPCYSQPPLSISPAAGQGISPFVNIQQNQVSPPRSQPQVMFSEVSPGHFILQQNQRPDLIQSQELAQSGLLLQSAHGQSRMILQNSNQPSLIFRSSGPTGLSLQGANQSNMLFANSSSAGGLMLQQGNTSAILPGQSTLIQNNGQGCLSYISLNAQNHIRPAIISPLQSLQPHSGTSMIQPNMGLAPLVQTATGTLAANPPVMIGQPFFAQPGIYVPRLTTQALASQPGSIVSPKPAVRPSSIVIDPHAHMMSSSLNPALLKGNQREVTLQSLPKPTISFSPTPINQASIPSLGLRPPQNQTNALPLPATASSTMSLMAPALTLPKSTPLVARLDGAPTQVNYMGSFDLSSSTLQSVFQTQQFNRGASEKITHLVQRALSSNCQEQIPGVEVKSTITNTSDGPRKFYSVIINEDILPVQKANNNSELSASATGLSSSLNSSSQRQQVNQLSEHNGTQPDWTKILPGSPSSSSTPSSAAQQGVSSSQHNPENLWARSHTGYVSIPIRPNAASHSGKPTLRRALKPNIYNHSKRKCLDSAPGEEPQAKRPVFGKTLREDGTYSGTLQQVVSRNIVESSHSAGADRPTNRDLPIQSQSQNTIQAILPKPHQDTLGERVAQPMQHAEVSAGHPQPQLHTPKQIHQQQQTTHKRASFPIISPCKKSPAVAHPANVIKERARKQILKKSQLKKDPASVPGRKGFKSPETAMRTNVSRRLKTTSHHPLIHHKKGNVELPQPMLEEEVVATPLDHGKDAPGGPTAAAAAADRLKSQSRLRFEISSDDGFSCQGVTVDDAWNQVLEKVQDVRAASRVKQLSYAGISGRSMFGVDHDAVVYLIEQLYGAVYCHRNYKFKFHKYDLDQADAEVALNPSGAARSESFTTRKPFDMFNFLKSVYRTKPGDDEREKEEEMALKSSRRATSLSLPMAMRFRKLKTFAKEAVDVYRSKIHGRGLFCKRNIDAGEMVIEYAGEVIRASLTDKREKYYESRGIGCYMFRIDDDEVVDATMHGSAARFINHSCEPNCFSKVILVDGKKHIVIFAMRPIKRGEELTYDYKFPIEEVKIPCSCGSKRCRKYLN